MAVERRDPVPPGKYWIVILAKAGERERWEAWTQANKGKVKTLATAPLKDGGLIGEQWAALFLANPAVFAALAQVPANDVGDWILFEVLEPVPWVGLGYPTIVKPGEHVESPDNVVDAPDPEPPPDLGSIFNGSVSAIAPWVVLTVLGVVALRRLIK